jgi:hypothetical protein
METPTTTKRISEGGRVRLSVQHGDDLQFYDLLYPQMPSEELERSLMEATKAFARSFSQSIKQCHEQNLRGRKQWLLGKNLNRWLMSKLH